MTRTVSTPDGEIEVTDSPDESESYATAITVSREIKRSDGNYGSDSDFASIQMQLSPAVSMENREAVLSKVREASSLLSAHFNGSDV